MNRGGGAQAPRWEVSHVNTSVPPLKDLLKENAWDLGPG